MNRRRVLVIALFLALAAIVVTVAGTQLAGEATERLTNGDFEAGFYAIPPGYVGNGWHWFHNGGEATYGYYDETWAPVIYEGEHSLMIEINTYDRAASDPDRYAGIYQTVAVVPGENYELFMAGMLRALADDPDREGYNYRVQYAVDHAGGTDWQAVDNWVELPWDTVHPRLSPGAMETFTATLTASGDNMTIFVRAWKKWGTTGRELDVNLDAISLKGAMPVDTSEPTVAIVDPPLYPVAGWDYAIAVESSNDVGVTRLELYDNDELVDSVQYDVGVLELSHDFTWVPETPGSHTLKAVVHDAGGATGSSEATLEVGEEGQFVTNGDFEGGFEAIPLGMVGEGWGWFYNDARAGYGFYDETWKPAIYEGEHSQMIEISTVGQAGSDPDRYAGIYQTVEGLQPGATYELSMYGMMRVLSTDSDRVGYNYRIQWGYLEGEDTDWEAVEDWVELPWDSLYTRLAPGTMSSYSTTFEPQSDTVTLFVRVWKKWGTTSRELDVNLDNITLKGYK